MLLHVSGKTSESLAHQSVPRIFRSRRVASIAVACVIVYAIAFFALKRDASYREETFLSAAGTTQPISIYIDEVAFDPIRQAIDVRFDLATSVNHGARYGGPFDRNVELSIHDGDSEQIVSVHRDEASHTHLVSLDVRGSVEAYPFDRYSSDVTISARESSGRGASRPIAIRATVWEGVPGWVTSVRALQNREIDGALTIALTLRRPLPVVSFGSIMYALMAIVALCSLCIGGLVFTGRRKVESTIVGAMVTMVFSVAVLRNVLPGAPPIGVTADVVIFLWAEVAVITGLCLLVVAWVKRGPGV